MELNLEQTFFYLLDSFLNLVCSVVYLNPTTNMRPVRVRTREDNTLLSSNSIKLI